MFYLKIFQLMALFFVLAVFITQIVIPLFRGVKLFPAFRYDRNIVNEKLTDVREKIDVQHGVQQAHLLEEQLKTSKLKSNGDKNE